MPEEGLGTFLIFMLRWLREELGEGNFARQEMLDTAQDLAMARALLKDPTISVAQVAKRLGRATFYAYFLAARSGSMSAPWGDDLYFCPVRSRAAVGPRLPFHITAK